ncbi:MAG: segregation and condensation protein A [Halothiobacillaceae bacterium]
MTQLPLDLYIPPDALSIFLETFEGPLDLLLYLIRRQNLDILDIPVAEVTRQYMEYLALMREMKLELAAEYLLMAAWLAEIKSRMLLPRPPASEEEDEAADPRAELVARLLEYERLGGAARALDERPRQGRDHWPGRVAVSGDLSAWRQPDPPQVALADLVAAMQAVMRRHSLVAHHHVRREPLSVRERMSTILRRLHSAGHLFLETLFLPAEGRAGMVVTFLAILELGKEGAIRLAQDGPFAAIELTAPESGDG